jgi:hypothetical protein
MRVQCLTRFVCPRLLCAAAAAGVSHIIGAARWLPPVRWLLAYIMTLVQAETAAMVRMNAAE